MPDLSQVPRELAERLAVKFCPHVEHGEARYMQSRCKECLEAVIREAMQKALEHIEHGILCGRLGGLNTIVEEIRSLKRGRKRIASSLTEQETTK